MKRFTLPIACLAFTVVAGSANAVVLNPGDAAYLFGSSSPAVSFVTSSIQTVTGINAALETRFTGTLYTEVDAEANGNLDFFYSYSNDLTSKDAVERFTMTNFAGYVTDVDYLSYGFFSLTADAPTYADRSLDGGTVGFQFQQPIGNIIPGNGVVNPGDTTDYMMIRTNAKTYTLGTTSVIDGAVGSVVTFAPSPEPATMLALGVGVAGLVRRRKLSAKK